MLPTYITIYGIVVCTKHQNVASTVTIAIVFAYKVRGSLGHACKMFAADLDSAVTV